VIRATELAECCREHEPTARRPRKRSTEEVVRDLVFHQLHRDGTLAQHGAMLGGEAMTDPAYTQRRELLPPELFASILEAGLKPLASLEAHPDAFFAGWRLVGVDGSEVSVVNTPANKKIPKAKSRRGRAAFAKVKLVTAVELGLHNPLAAETGTLQDYEVDLALRLWSRVPEHSLVIIDRLYGVAKHLDQILQASQGRDMAVLVRARGQVKSQRLRRLSDGSSLVQIRSARRPGQPAGEPITVREVRAVLRVPGKQSVRIRFWTTLLDAEKYPASALVELYVQRWEHELTYRELKLDVRRADVLNSHTPAAALQELAAKVLALAAVAQVRAAATEPLAQPARRISLRKLLLATLSLWEAFELAGPILTPEQKAYAMQRYFARLKREAILPERRPRHCPRAVRQPVTGWPRLRRRSESSGAAVIKLVR
jgi:putative transposase